MKNAIFSFCLALFALFFLSACGSVEPLRSMEASVKIRVECQNTPGVRSMVLGMLKRARAKDITETSNPSYLEIEAAYYTEDNSPEQLTEIASLLEVSSGVYHVELMENHNMVKQGR